MTTSRYRNIRFAGALCVLGVVMTLFAQQNDSLSVVGQSGSARVARISGKDYVEVEGLVRLMRGSIRFNGNEIVVTWDSANGNSPAPPEPGFSKAFVTAGIEAMAEQREWRAALKNAIESGYPLTEFWLDSMRARAQHALGVASVSASSAADKDALPFLNNQFNNMSVLSDKYLRMALSITYIDPRSLDNDALDQKITACTRSLASMATTNQFIDDGSCH